MDPATESTLDLQAHVSTDASGATQAIVNGIRSTRAGGTVVLVGSADEIPLSVPEVAMREMNVTGTFRYTGTSPIARALLESGQVELDSLVTHEYGMEQDRTVAHGRRLDRLAEANRHAARTPSRRAESARQVMTETLLSVQGISKSFPGVKALDDVSFEVRPGTVHALCGENGAGKSTLMKIINGIYQPDGGTIRVRGEEVRIKNPIEARAHGIAMISQELNYVPGMTIAESFLHGPAADETRQDRLEVHP